MMNKLIQIVCWMLAPVCLPAQVSISLNDAINEGIERNYSINIARNQSEIARKNVYPGNAGFLPVVDAYGSVDKAVLNAQQHVFTGSQLEQKQAGTTVTTAGIRAEWVFFDGKGKATALEKLKELWKISDLDTRITLEEVVSKIIVSYCAIIREQQILDACRERLDVSQFRYLVAEKRMDAGLASELEWLQSQVLLHADSTGWNRQLAIFKKSKVLLNQLLAADIGRDFVTEDSIRLTQIPSLDELIVDGINQNPRYKKAVEQVNLSKLDEKSIKSEFYPKLSLKGSYGYYKNETEAAFIRYNRYYGPQAGIYAGIRIFDGNQLRNDLSNARIQTITSEMKLRELEQELIALITETYLEYQSYLESVALGKAACTLAGRNVAIARQAWESGAISSLHLRETQEELFHAATELVTAIYHAKVAETALLQLSGRLIP